VTVGAQNATTYAISPAESSLIVNARSTLHAIRANVAGLTGTVAAAWNADGTIASSPPLAIHVEFPLDQVRSGNAMQDREMLKMVDARRFPKVAGDLKSVEVIVPPDRYRATGEITLAGRARPYGGEFTIAAAGDDLTVEGEVSIDMRDFGLQPPRLLNFTVDPVLRIKLRLVARKTA